VAIEASAIKLKPACLIHYPVLPKYSVRLDRLFNQELEGYELIQEDIKKKVRETMDLMDPEH